MARFEFEYTEIDEQKPGMYRELLLTSKYQRKVDGLNNPSTFSYVENRFYISQK